MRLEPRSGDLRYPRKGLDNTLQERCKDVLRLDNGNTLVACGTQARLLEVNRTGKIEWEFTANDHPELNLTNACNLQKLKNGSILVTNFLRGNSGRGAHAFILSKEKQVIWSFTDHQNFTAASQVWAIQCEPSNDTLN